jgi:hypothetical protein
MTITSFQVIAPSTAMPGGPPGIQGPTGAAAAYKINAQAGTSIYTVGPADGGSLIVFSGTIAGVLLTLTPIVLTAGWWATIKNNNSSGLISISVVGGGALLDGLAMGTIDPQCAQTIVFSGLNFDSLGPCDGGIF